MPCLMQTKIDGVTQLVNKNDNKKNTPYNPADGRTPRSVESEFTRNDMDFMKAFNIQAGVALQNAKLFAHSNSKTKTKRYAARAN